MHTCQLLHRPVGPQENLDRLAVTGYRRLVDGGFGDVSPVDLRGKIPGRPEFRYGRVTVPRVHVRSVTAAPPRGVGRVRVRRHVFG